MKSFEEKKNLKLYKCDKCSIHFNIIKDLIDHLSEYRCREIFDCKLCDYKTIRRGDFNKHLKTKKCVNNTKISNKNETYKCTNCSKIFRDSYDLTRHLNKKISCTNASMVINNHTQNTQNNIMNNNIIINAHDPSAFIKELNTFDRSMYNNMLQAHSINSPESIKRLEEIASKEPYRKPVLIDPDEYSSDEEESIRNTNDSNLMFENSKYLSNILCKAFLDSNKLNYAPFFRVPNTKKLKVKYNNQLHEWDELIVHDLIDSFMHKMEILKKEKNISLYSLRKSIHKAYDEFRTSFVKVIKQYKIEQKRSIK